jgi:hypothetical protein
LHGVEIDFFQTLIDFDSTTEYEYFFLCFVIYWVLNKYNIFWYFRICQVGDEICDKEADADINEDFNGFFLNKKYAEMPRKVSEDSIGKLNTADYKTRGLM